MTDMAEGDGADRKRGGGARLVYETLREEILDLVLKPGAPVDEVGVAERFAMSRTPVREALVRLAGDGLVTMLPNRSTVVSAIDFPNLYAFFDALTLMYRVTTRLAAEFHDTGDLATIRARQAVFAQAVMAGDTAGMILANRDFHAAVAEAGRNSYYTGLFVRLLDEGRRLLRLYYYPAFVGQERHPFILEHEAMIAAIVARDVARCDVLAKDHADGIVRQIQEMIAADRRQHVVL